MTKTAVVTGATKGLGRAIAEIFAENGFDLFVCARTEGDLAAMILFWKERFPERLLYTKALDLRNKAEVQGFAKAIGLVWPKLDVLVNNAGLYQPGNISEEPDGAMEAIMETNFFSAYHLTRGLLPLMQAHQHGYVFNMCSIASFMAYPNAGSYSISKFAMLGFSRVLREEMKPHGIKVTAILPGNTWSDAWKGATLPTERLMQAADVAKAIWGCYTLSDTAVVEELLLRPQLGDL